uniref:Uncharacterized protein n=1 Tax=Arundo donax TaxID=35708 RepID=A0A0A9FUF4_ARUDO
MAFFGAVFITGHSFLLHVPRGSLIFNLGHQVFFLSNCVQWCPIYLLTVG